MIIDTAQVILDLRLRIAETANGLRHCRLPIDDCRLAERMRTGDGLRLIAYGLGRLDWFDLFRWPAYS